MDKPSPSFRPHEIRVRAHLVLRVTVAVGAVSCVSHPRVVGVEHILPALRINHAVVQEIVGQVVARHAQLLRHLCHRHAVVRQEHCVAVQCHRAAELPILIFAFGGYLT